MSIFIRLCAIALVSALSSALVYAAGESLNAQVNDFVVDRYHDGQRLIEGPTVATPPVIEPNQSCAALYQRRLVLLQQMHDYKPAYWDDPRNQAAVFLGAIWTPAFYFLGYSAITAQLDKLNEIDPQTELDALRHVSAQLRCFEK
jgi:hypothetical protein